MNKVVKIIVIIVIAAAVIAGGILLYINYYNQSHYIGEQAATKIAVEDAGMSLSEINFSECDLDTENRTRIYEVSFISGMLEYEYKLDAVSGNILWKQTENAYD